MQDEYVKLEKGTVQVTRTGYGPTPLVLLSGFSTLFPGLEYGALGTELAKKFPVLIPSKFGYGYSDLTDAPRDADAIVEEYRAVLSALKEPRPGAQSWTVDGWQLTLELELKGYDSHKGQLVSLPGQEQYVRYDFSIRQI